jgi:hypothetical protein
MYKYVECSSLTSEGVREVLEHAARATLRRNVQPVLNENNERAEVERGLKKTSLWSRFRKSK